MRKKNHKNIDFDGVCKESLFKLTLDHKSIIQETMRTALGNKFMNKYEVYL